jgi:hypothetical protein
MRIYLLLALAFLPLAAGCFADPVERALAGQSDPTPKYQRVERVKDRREKIADAVGARGGKIALDLEQLDKPVLSADLHGLNKPGAILDAVGPLTKCRTLLLFNTTFGDGDMARLQGLPVLQTLNLSSTKITDGGLVTLRSLPAMRELFLDNTTVSDAGMQQVASVANLRILELSRTSVTDEGVAYLANLKLLEKLVIGGRGITDRSLAHLKHLRTLRKLTLAGTRVTDAGVRELYAALPRITILR